ncbi:hypothetical protein QUF61_17825 [Candidatus Venteria ishoeyi]|uniref:hypothetical protein n=1 Tax=Candidatus Venteria ishoeyi TaxID=1899563 RepID=UPI0025A66E30|nr:hypothetical protein [Candidatus Venteria ishoeyi]MDM8548353.1 hypothetical protein [Candidatus Venteria ishoeyi]
MNVIKHLSSIAQDKNWFVTMPLGELDKSCCPRAQTEVIDFDQTKTLVSRMMKKPTPKSCDALKILEQRLDFIEMKGWREFIRRNPSSAVPSQITKFNLKQKITDSLGVLKDVITLMQLGDAAQEQYGETVKYYIVVIDIHLEDNPLEHLALSLDFLSESSTPVRQQIIQGLSEELGKLPEQLTATSELSANLHQPLLKSCDDIDAYYASSIQEGGSTL